MITDVNNSVIMTSTVAGYANKARRGEIKGVEPARRGGERKGDADRCCIVKYEKIKRQTGYDGDPYIVMIEEIRTPLGALTFCHTKTLWTMAHPQNTMPRPMKTDVTIAGVEWNWMNVYRIMPVDHTNTGLISRSVTMII